MTSATTGGATAADFAKWERHARTCDVDALRHIVADCSQASKAMRGWNPDREGFYTDQGATYHAELRRRGAA
jgi:hypothetical protein